MTVLVAFLPTPEGEAAYAAASIEAQKRSPVGEFLLGGNAQRILLDADRPVLAVRP